MIKVHVTKITGGMEDATVDVLANLDTESDAIAAATLRAVADKLTPIAKVTRERGGAPEYGDVR